MSIDTVLENEDDAVSVSANSSKGGLSEHVLVLFEKEVDGAVGGVVLDLGTDDPAEVAARVESIFGVMNTETFSDALKDGSLIDALADVAEALPFEVEVNDIDAFSADALAEMFPGTDVVDGLRSAETTNTAEILFGDLFDEGNLSNFGRGAVPGLQDVPGSGRGFSGAAGFPGVDERLMDGPANGEAESSSWLGTIFGAIGGSAGAKFGGSIGSAGGLAGKVAGTAIGWLAGKAAGAYAGEWVADSLPQGDPTAGDYGFQPYKSLPLPRTYSDTEGEDAETAYNSDSAPDGEEEAETAYANDPAPDGEEGSSSGTGDTENDAGGEGAGSGGGEEEDTSAGTDGGSSEGEEDETEENGGDTETDEGDASGGESTSGGTGEDDDDETDSTPLPPDMQAGGGTDIEPGGDPTEPDETLINYGPDYDASSTGAREEAPFGYGLIRPVQDADAFEFVEATGPSSSGTGEELINYGPDHYDNVTGPIGGQEGR